MMKLPLYICGEGLGHASRCLVLGRQLEQNGHKVTYHTYGAAKLHLENNGLRVRDTPRELSLVIGKNGLSLTSSILKTLQKTRIDAYQNIKKDLKKSKPDLILSDSYFLPAIASQRLKIPYFFITNQTNTHQNFLNQGLIKHVTGLFIKKIMHSTLENTEKIIIPDFPPPDTLCWHNLEDHQAFDDKYHFTGPWINPQPKPGNLPEKYILYLFNPRHYPKKMVLNFFASGKNHPQHQKIFLLGEHNIKYKHVFNDHDRTMIPYLPNASTYITSSDLVVTTGGHHTIMEALSAGIPVISIPHKNHFEQQKNAARLLEQGVGSILSHHELHELDEHLDAVINDVTIRSSCQKYKELAQKMEGAKKVAKLVAEVKT